MNRLLAWALLGLILLLAVYLRSHRLGRWGFWMDECYSAEISAGHGYAHFDLPTNQVIARPPDLQAISRTDPWWHVLTAQGRDVHPPFYFLVLRWWRDIFGSSDVAMRSLSVLCSVAAVAIMYAVGADLYGRGAGLWTALLMALAISQIDQGRQARDYALLVLLAAIALLAVIRIEKNGWRMGWGVLLAAACFLCLATHWLSIGFVAALVAYVVIVWRGSSRRRALIFFAGVGLIILLTLVPLELHQIRHAAYLTWWLQDRQPHHLSLILASMADLPLRLFGSAFGFTKLYLGWWLLFLIAPILAVRGRRDLLLPVFALYGTLAFPLAIDVLHHTVTTLQTRYMILMGLPMCLIVAGIFRNKRRGSAVLANLLPMAIAAYSAVSLLTYYSEQNIEDWRQLAQMIASETRDGEPIIFASPWQDDPEATPATAYLCASRYLPSGHPIYLANQAMSNADERSLHSGSACFFSVWSFAMPDQTVPGCKVEDLHWHWPLCYVGRVRLPVEYESR